MDKESLRKALLSIGAAYISIHTLSKQPANTASHNFMDAEPAGLQNIVELCKEHQVSSVIYVTFLGVAPIARSMWVKGRWQSEQFILNATAIRAGMIVGRGGQWFNSVISNAKKKYAITKGKRNHKMVPIAICDLVYYMIGVHEEERSFGQCYDIGNDEQISMSDMIDVVAAILGNKPPKKLSLLRSMSPVI